MKRLFLLAGLAAISFSCYAQPVAPDDATYLRKKEDSLKEYANRLIQANIPAERFKADSIFTKMLVRALKTPNSFYYPFDSLQTISKLYSPDSSFRIFTWQMVINENVVRQHGAIQMKTYDGSLKLFPLIDKSDITINLADTFGNNKGWIGAVYYKIIQKKSGNKDFYTLLGYDENNINSTRKIIEVLQFSNDEPVFGGRFFSFEKDAVFKSSISRYIMEFKKDAGARLNYDDDLDMIVFEHLESETSEPNKKWTYIPDGDYEAFKWENGKWIHVEKVFNYVTPEGQAPVPNPIQDTKDNIMEDKLEKAPAEDSKSTQQKPKAVKPKKNSKN